MTKQQRIKEAISRCYVRYNEQSDKIVLDGELTAKELREIADIMEEDDSDTDKMMSSEDMHKIASLIALNTHYTYEEVMTLPANKVIKLLEFVEEDDSDE